MRPDRVLSSLYVPFDISVVAGKAAWEALLAPGADLSAYPEGARIYDSVTGLALEMRQSPTGKRWYSLNGLVRRVTALTDVTAYHWGKFVGSTSWQLSDTAGEATFGVFMTNALAGQQVYVLMQGDYLIESGAPGMFTPNAIGTDANALAFPVSVSGEFYMGYNFDAVTVSGVEYALCTVGTPIIIP